VRGRGDPELPETDSDVDDADPAVPPCGDPTASARHALLAATPLDAQPASPPRAKDRTRPDRPERPVAEPSYGVTSTDTASPVSPDTPSADAEPPSLVRATPVPGAATWVSPPRPPTAAAVLSPVGPLVAVATALPPEMTSENVLPVRPDVAVDPAAPPAPPIAAPVSPAPPGAVQSYPAKPFVALAAASPVSPERDSPAAPLVPVDSAHALPLSPLLAPAVACPPVPGTAPAPVVAGAGSDPALTELVALPVSPDRAVEEEAPRTVTATAIEVPERPELAVADGPASP
jgi:hypothetical protein